MKVRHLMIAGLAAALALPAMAQEKASEAEAKKMLQTIQDSFKSGGTKGAADFINGGGCKVKDLGCTMFDTKANVLGARQQALVGQQMPDMADVDGKSMSGGMINPLKAGKATWEDAFKTTAPGAKAIVTRAFYCAKLNADTGVCTSVTK